MSEEKKQEAEAVCDAPEKTEEPKAEKSEKKKSKKDAQLEKLQAEYDKTNDLLLRTAAEFDNYKKRTEREKNGVAEYAKAGVIKQLLPILVNVERAAAADKESPEYLKGVEMIIKQFEALAEKRAITEIAAVGDSFDPNLHEAVMHIEDENLGDNAIAEVLQKGYKIGDTVIRHAMVKVAN